MQSFSDSAPHGSKTAQADFLARGLASRERARRSGRYVPATDVLAKLQLRLRSAKSAAQKNRDA